MRRRAKAVNSGIVYGQSKYGLAKSLGISNAEAQDFIDKYFETYPKVKEYMDSEFKIVDYNDGLRPEDFVFVLETEDGKYFSAKPIGTVEEKEQYMKDMDSIIGKMATVKYFDWSTDGIPLQPVLKTIRDYE